MSRIIYFFTFSLIFIKYYKVRKRFHIVFVKNFFELDFYTYTVTNNIYYRFAFFHFCYCICMIRIVCNIIHILF